MQALRWQARAYISCTLFAGVALYLWQLWHFRVEHSLLLLMLIVFAAVTQTLKVEGATARTSYQISWIAYGASFVLLNPLETTIVILIAHVAEWIWHRYPWYIQSFNMAGFVIVAGFAAMVWGMVSTEQDIFELTGAIGFLLTAAIVTLLNHLMVGLVIWMARGESLMRSGVFNLLTLMIDFVSFGMGIASGLIWMVNPYAVIFILSPLYLIYTTLQVPSLQQQTRTEPKTGLYNARYFSEVLAAELERAHKFDRPLTVVMGDLDLLRNINNNYGHLAGDMVLVGIAQILRESVRDYDFVSRFGGEEYAILMPETSLAQALPLVEKLRAAVEAARFEVSTSVTPLSATMSFGVAEREFPDQTAEQIIHNADLAVYRVKSTTRNRVCYYANGEIKDFEQGAALPVTASPVTEAPPPNPVSRLGLAQVLRPITVAANGNGAVNKPLPSSISQQATLPGPQGSTPHTASTAASTEKVPLKTPPIEWVTIYIGILSGLALGLLGWTYTLGGAIHWQGIIVFTGLVLFTEWLAIDIYTRNTSVSTSIAPLVAGACLFGATGVLVLSFVLSAAATIKHRSPIPRFFFNLSNHLLAGLFCVNFLYWAGLHITIETSLLSALAVVAATILTYLSTTILLAGVIHLSSGISPRDVWMERFYWLWPYYLALGVVAYALAVGYLTSGLLGVFIFFVPLLMLRISQNQYLSRTESMVVQLRAANTELVERSKEISAMNEGLILALSHASDLRDPYVHGHALHVARYAVLIAEELGLREERIESIRQAALLHDIGKIGIPEAILFKPSRLTAEEYELMKQHAGLGAALVQGIESLQHLAPLIRHHHEYYNGHGYPAELANDNIPLEARILSVADAIEAMASDRPYRKAGDAQAILRELQKHSGTQFDPIIVDAFTKVIRRKGEALIVNSARNVLRFIESQHADQGDGIDDTVSMSEASARSAIALFPSKLDNMNIALQRAIAAHRRMEATSQEGRELAETLLRVASTINTMLDKDRVLDLILEQLAQVMDYENASIMLIEDEMLNSVARRSIHVPEGQSLSVQVDKLDHVREVIEERRVVIISDTHDDNRWMRRAGSETIRSWLGIPLIVKDRIIGLLNLSNRVPGYYTERHIQVATAFAAHAATAIENARLYTQAQEDAITTARLYEELQQERALLAQRVDERTSELKAANERLTSALRTKDEFLAMISHELRTPLNAILLLSESMQNGVYGVIESRQINVLDNVQQSARHLLALINDILDMSKIESGMFELDIGPVSAGVICRNSLRIIEAAARTKDIELVRTFDPRVDTVCGDERRLAQVLVNLLSNAVKFTPEGGKVGLEVVSDEAQNLVHFTVWDTGIGIAEEDMGRLFQPFVQLDSKLSRQYEGTGLGLALVHRLTQLHGGKVALQSKFGLGSRFTVSIPWQDEFSLQLVPFGLRAPAIETDQMPEVGVLSDAEWLASLGLDVLVDGSDEELAVETVEPATTDVIARNGPLILLAEDNEIGVEAMQDYLLAHHYRVIVARSGAEAIARTQAEQPDLILMDIQMPDMDGLEATTKIRNDQRFSHVPIIALTALAMPGDRDRCLAAGANEYLSKPVSMKHLVGLIETHLQQQLAHTRL